jgi:EAL domain-containing protein (putative c-di-GMP-specific phosphodiesterase class I)
MLEVPRQAAVVRGIIALAKGLGLSVVAEGVETPDQATALRDEGCDLMQGFHFARPLTAADFADRLAGTP